MKELKEKRNISIFKKENGLLFVNYGNQQIEVHIKQCFPWSTPGEFLSLRDKDDNEVCLIENLSELDSDTQKLIRQELSFSQFVLKIERVEKVEEDVELRQFHVLTNQGSRVFQTKLEDWPEVLENGVVLIEDLSGDIFRIEDWRLLDQSSKKELSAYIS
jgi:hypothetical protein